jgi:type IV secretory pathway TraG/TraD family ATPase VirD4
MVELTASSSFSLTDIRDEKTIIYFVIPAQHAEYYGFWTSIFFRSVFNACMREMPHRHTLPCYVLYDEFGHSTLPGFVSVANTIRGYKVSLSIVLQSISQLQARYGQAYAYSIQGGFGSYLTYSGADPQTAQFFENVSGRVVEKQKTRLRISASTAPNIAYWTPEPFVLLAKTKPCLYQPTSIQRFSIPFPISPTDVWPAYLSDTVRQISPA